MAEPGLRRKDAGIKLFCLATDLLSHSARAMLGALVAGERDGRVLAALALGKMRPKSPPCPRRE